MELLTNKTIYAMKRFIVFFAIISGLLIFSCTKYETNTLALKNSLTV